MGLILCGVCAGNIPAAHTAHLHRFTLPHGNTELFVQLVRQLHISLFIAGIPVRGVISGFASFDADEVACGEQRGKAHLRKPLGILGAEAFFLCHDAPVVAAPEVDVQLALVGAYLPLLEALILIPNKECKVKEEVL